MIYSPAEDSFLINELVKNYSKGRKVLDVGSGSGILARTALKQRAKKVIASDIDNSSVSYLRHHGLHAVKSDLFSKIKGKFDLIIFNPPYLPKEEMEDKESRVSTTGGKNGDETVLRFLKYASPHISSSGIILLLLSSFTPRKRIKAFLKKLSFNYKVVASRNLFFEKLEVWKLIKIKT